MSGTTDRPAPATDRAPADPAGGPAAPPPFRFPTLRVGLAAALVAALANVFLATDPYANPDSHMFEALARSLMAGQGLVYREPIFPDLPLYAFRSPGYGVFLALGLSLAGVTGALVLQGALHGLSATLLGSLAGRWAGPVAAWSAFALRFVWPAGWSQAGQLMSEGLLEFLSLLTVWLAVRGGSDRAWRWAAAAGVAAALAVLTRPAGLGFALAAGAWLLVKFPRGALAMAAAALIAWAPWPVRNAMRLNAFVPLVTNGGVTAWGIQSEQPPIVGWQYMAEHTELGELGLDRHFRDETFALIARDPLGYARRTVGALLRYVGPLGGRERDVWLHRFAMLALLPALLWGASRKALLLPALCWVFHGMLVVPLAMHSRYRFPSEWCVIAAAAIGIAAASARWGARRTALLAAGALALCVAYTLVVARG